MFVPKDGSSACAKAKGSLEGPGSCHPSVLVTGGAGYIGAHTVKALAEQGYRVTIFDDLSRGHREHVGGNRLVVGDVSDGKALAALFGETHYDAVVHFAGESLVGESVRDPAKYYLRNVVGGITLLSAASKAGITKFVFSSSAGVYGTPEVIPIPETAPLAPMSPYGESKAILEKALQWYDAAYGLKSVSLRYFNAAGADPSGEIGEDHEPETHLIPLVIKAALTGEAITIFGSDYPTPDGTCVRDYVHVSDLASAHILALEALFRGAPTSVFNIGTGCGFSNMEILRGVEGVTGLRVPYVIGDRRAGDPPTLVSSCEKAKEVLGWTPRLSSLEQILETAWRWHSRGAKRKHGDR